MYSAMQKNPCILCQDEVSAEKDVGPLLFALWVVSDPAINSGSAAKVIFLQKRLSLPLILRPLQVVPL
nr:hypothetical protein CFP56_10853 [Quercus suber]